jgi:hypothetical protein
MIIGRRKKLYFATGALRYFVGGHVGMAEEINHAVVIIMELINIIWLCYMAAFFVKLIPNLNAVRVKKRSA